MSGQPRIYLDNAATSFPKPDAVTKAMVEYATTIGASPGRGTYAESLAGSDILRRARRSICRLIGGTSPAHLIFTLNCSDALNLAIHGTCAWWRQHKPGEPVHIVTTEMDHNSVLRPLNELSRHGDVQVTRVGADAEGTVDPRDVVAAIRPETRLVAMVHASNVTGTLQDITPVGVACRERGVPFLVDAAQSLGHVPVDVDAMGIDLLAFPGHKGLLGPLGTGGLYIRPGAEHRLNPIRQGGTGSRSESDVQPVELPDRFEPGSHNTIGIAGLLAGVEWVLERTVEAVREHEAACVEEFLRLFPGGRAGFRLHGPAETSRRLGVFAITHERLSPVFLAEALEERAGVLSRAGIHCAPGAHVSLGTIASGGACRLSVGPFTTIHDIRRVCACLNEIGSEAPQPQDQSDLGSSIQPASV